MADRARIERMSNPMITTDGKYLQFTLETDQGPGDVEIPISDIGQAVTFLGITAARGCAELGVEAPPFSDEQMLPEALPLNGIGIATTPDGSTARLVLHLPGFWLGFEVESTRMSKFAGEMASIARLLGARGAKN